MLVFKDGKLIGYVLSGLSKQNILHLMFRNGFTEVDPGLDKSWKGSVDSEDFLRSINWSGNLSGKDLWSFDPRQAFFHGFDPWISTRKNFGTVQEMEKCYRGDRRIDSLEYRPQVEKLGRNCSMEVVNSYPILKFMRVRWQIQLRRFSPSKSLIR